MTTDINQLLANTQRHALVNIVTCIGKGFSVSFFQVNKYKKMNKELIEDIHANAIYKGFWEAPVNIAEKIALIHSEVSEALEADRKSHITKTNILAVLGWVSDEDFKESFEKNVKNSFEDELADICIRVMDLARYKGIDLTAHIEAKHRYNKMRAYKHGKNY